MEHKDNLFTYLKWRGDLPITDVTFNEVDALILSELSYIRLDGVVCGPGEEGMITIREANERYNKRNVKMMYYAEKEELFDVLARSPRFADMTLCNYVSMTDVEQQQQFAAMHINITPSVTFIAFRGTDSTIVGWKEDFNMSYMMPVPAQQSAVDYVNQTVKGMFRKYYMGGHSKGGNLAIYSGMFCEPRIQKKIVKIYSFDGPGFNRNMVNDPAYAAIQDKILAYVPEESIIGLLMEHEEDYKVVKSNGVSLQQHEGFFWKVNRDRFELADELNPRSKDMSDTVKSWLAKVSTEDRKIVVDTLFSLFENAGLEDFNDLENIDANTVGALLKAVTMVPKKERDLLGKLLLLFVEEHTKTTP